MLTNTAYGVGNKQRTAVIISSYTVQRSAAIGNFLTLKLKSKISTECHLTTETAARHGTRNNLERIFCVSFAVIRLYTVAVAY